MYEFVALSLKCRFCGESLMDNKTLVDNEPSINLHVKYQDKHGEIHLSSIYGSYNYKCNIDIPKMRSPIFPVLTARKRLIQKVNASLVGQK
ncbi:MAG: hypothetical protein R2750_11270 [Bacteroidales bacterium]